MLWVFLLAAATAFGGKTYTGVPVVGIEGLSPPRFQTVDTGWAATVPNGFVTIYVGHSEVEAQRWIERQLLRVGPVAGTANEDLAKTLEVDEAFGGGLKLLIFRAGNVGVCSKSRTNALPWAKAIRSAIVDLNIPWPSAPKISLVDGLWKIESPTTSRQVSFVGGIPTNSGDLRFHEAPYRLISWDSWGRAAWTDTASR